MSGLVLIGCPRDGETPACFEPVTAPSFLSFDDAMFVIVQIIKTTTAQIN